MSYFVAVFSDRLKQRVLVGVIERIAERFAAFGEIERPIE